MNPRDVHFSHPPLDADWRQFREQLESGLATRVAEAMRDPTADPEALMPHGTAQVISTFLSDLQVRELKRTLPAVDHPMIDAARTIVRDQFANLARHAEHRDSTTPTSVQPHVTRVVTVGVLNGRPPTLLPLQTITFFTDSDEIGLRVEAQWAESVGVAFALIRAVASDMRTYESVWNAGLGRPLVGVHDVRQYVADLETELAAVKAMLPAFTRESMPDPSP